jgi:hypothetical protein
VFFTLSNDWHGEETNRRLWGPLLRGAGIDLMISGHTHKDAFFAPEFFDNDYPLLIRSPETGAVIEASEEGMSVRIRSLDGGWGDPYLVKARRLP